MGQNVRVIGARPKPLEHVQMVPGSDPARAAEIDPSRGVVPTHVLYECVDNGILRAWRHASGRIVLVRMEYEGLLHGPTIQQDAEGGGLYSTDGDDIQTIVMPYRTEECVGAELRAVCAGLPEEKEVDDA